MYINKLIWVSKFIIVFVIFRILISCTSAGKNIDIDYPDMPPLIPMEKIGHQIVPISQYYKLAVLTFIDKTGKAGLVADPIADVLTTELFNTKRFALYDRSDFSAEAKKLSVTKEETTGGGTKKTTEVIEKGESEIPSEKTKGQWDLVNGKEKVDGILIGYITSFDIKGTFEFDYRIINAYSKGSEVENIIVFSGTGKVGYKTDEAKKSIDINRSEVRKVAEDIKQRFAGKFDKLSISDEIRVTSVEGPKITLNFGENANLRQGYAGYVVRPTELKTYEYLAVFVIMNTFEGASTAYIVSDKETWGNVKVGSIVKIK